MGRLKSVEDVKKEIVLVSNGLLEAWDTVMYSGNKSKILFQKTDCKHIFERIVANVLKKRIFTCPECEPDKFPRTKENLERTLFLRFSGEIIKHGNSFGDRDKITLKAPCGCLLNRQIGNLLKNGPRCKEHTEGWGAWKDRVFYEENLLKLPYGSFEIVGKFINPTRQTEYLCKNCGKIELTTYDKIIGRKGRCQHCSRFVKSIREEYVAILLEDFGIVFQREKRIGNFYYDFYLPKYNTLIEYDGEQHQTGEFLSISLPNYDAIKNEVAKKEGYELLRLCHNSSIIKDILQFLKKFNDYPGGE